MIKAWQSLLDSLATKGGQLFILCFFVTGLMALVIWVTLRDAGDSQATTVIISTFSAFSGALLGFLTGQSVGAQRKTDPPELPPLPLPQVQVQPIQQTPPPPGGWPK